jgi:hypothetical protein
MFFSSLDTPSAELILDPRPAVSHSVVRPQRLANRLPDHLSLRRDFSLFWSDDACRRSYCLILILAACAILGELGQFLLENRISFLSLRHCVLSAFQHMGLPLSTR